MEKSMPPAIILCGGRGTRLRDVTEVLPKPMVPIGEWPIVWHIMRCFAAFGVKRFILCLGYKREAFVDYFANYRLRAADATLTLGGPVEPAPPPVGSDWRVTLAATGLDTMTGGRVLRAARHLAPEDGRFFLTYGDGLADIDLDALLKRHLEGGKLITVSAVHPEARFGELELSGDHVTGFTEKPAQAAGYINGGFMVLERGFIGRYLDPERDDYLEREPMSRAAREGAMLAFRHEGFWQCMDSPREYELLNKLWAAGNAPWTRYWK